MVLDVTDLLLTKYFEFGRYWRKTGVGLYVHQLLIIDCKKPHDSVKREVLHNILFEFGIPKKLDK